jgi:thiol-disulfide isomerase/thioredoxin
MFNKPLQSISAILILFAPLQTNIHANDASLMEPLTYQQWTDKLQSHIPNIVVVDMWAMWCVSCIERFPEMVAMHARYKNDNVVFVSMNLDDRYDSESLAAADSFLRSMNAQFDHYRMDENLMTAFEQTDLIGIPAVLIYGQDGKERYRLTGDNPNKQFTEYDIEQAIITLLK